MTRWRLVVGSPEQFIDIRYATGFVSVDPVVYLHGPRRVLVVPAMEVSRALRARSDARVKVVSCATLVGARRAPLSAWVLALLRRERVRSVRVSPWFPLGAAERLRRAGVRVSVARGRLFPERAVKREDELRCLRETQRAAVAAVRAAVRRIARARVDRRGVLREGRRVLTAEALRAFIEEELRRRDCVARDVIVACGELAADPHERGHGALRAGQPIILDVFPQHRGHGYWGDVTRTVVRGTPPRRVAEMYAAVRAAQRAALAVLRAGVTGGAVHRAASQALRARGFRTRLRPRAEGFTHGCGHGVGLEIHEAPSLARGSRHRLRSGHVVTVEPGLYYPGVGGVRIEDAVVVTRTGWRYLATCPRRLQAEAW